MSEKVLVFPAKLLEEYEECFKNKIWVRKFGNYSVMDRFIARVTSSRNAKYLDRELAESDESYKQIIPYAVLVRSASAGSYEYFTYKRTKRGGESRLHDKYSLGVGGHINPCDGEGGNDTYRAAFCRELLEEVNIQEPIDDHIAALIYNSETAVGRVHFGVVHFVPVSEDVRSSDPAIAEGNFLSKQKIWDRRDDFEDWSQLIINNLL